MIISSWRVFSIKSFVLGFVVCDPLLLIYIFSNRLFERNWNTKFADSVHFNGRIMEWHCLFWYTMIHFFTNFIITKTIISDYISPLHLSPWWMDGLDWIGLDWIGLDWIGLIDHDS